MELFRCIPNKVSERFQSEDEHDRVYYTLRKLDQDIRSDTDTGLYVPRSVYVSDNPPTRSRQDSEDFFLFIIIYSQVSYVGCGRTEGVSSF